jgi:TonB-dependent SusC/RagA subfamily outer membrane receptor
MELFSSQIEMNEFQQAVSLFKGLFPLGISQITVYNRNGEKMAERLVFVRNEDDKKVQISMNRKEYQTRQKVELDLLSLLPENDTILSTLSVSVVNEDYYSADGNNQNIESFLLLDSELKGPVESPASFFMDEQGITSGEKLDLLMMVNGWRSYYWNELEKFTGVKLPGWADYGLTLKGNVTRTWGGKPADFAKVVLGPFSRNFLFEKDTTDENGYFHFNNLYLKDSALIMITAETKNRSNRTDIALKQTLAFDSLVSVDKLETICPDINVPMKFYRDIYYRQMADQEYEKGMGGILLDEVNIGGKQGPQLEGHFRLYGEPDHSFTITSDDWTFTSIAEYLETKVAGVVVTGDEIRIRAGYGNPLLLVDGLEVSWDYVKYLPLGDIDKIEILKSAALMAIYGSRGGNGVIAVLTKMGRGDMYNEFVRNIPGRITPQVKGFQQPRAFYSPKYTVNNINDPKPDYRPTLYWNPDVAFQPGNQNLNSLPPISWHAFMLQLKGSVKMVK